ncbi:MAG TPA: methyltransferase domain-containing protein [Polyangiales bacterium]|nr:methyltransferase domain-containing protein [Polyangiales bacterium]
MSIDRALERSYQNPIIGHGYDALSWLLYRPLGGRNTLRERALDFIDIRHGQRVLELGCGTGGITQKLVARGAAVTAVDWSEPMLRIARARAGSARFVRSEITSHVPDRTYDLVLLAFVLHECVPDARARALAVARAALTQHGRLAVVDHAEPETGALAKAIYALIHGFEPPPLGDWARSDFEAELVRAGFTPDRRLRLARGTARAVVASAAQDG